MKKTGMFVAIGISTKINKILRMKNETNIDG